MTLKMKVVCLGDSMTRWPDIKDYDLWPSVLEGELRKEGIDAQVINSGISGDCTAGMSARFHQDVVQHQPDYVVIMGGGNDVWWNVPQQVTRANMYSLIKRALHHNIIPVVGIADISVSSDIYAQNGEAWEPELGLNGFIEGTRLLFQSYIDDIIKACSLLCIDFREVMRLRFFDPQGNRNEKYYCVDGMHLSKEGNQVLGEFAAAFFKSFPEHQGILRT